MAGRLAEGAGTLTLENLLEIINRGQEIISQRLPELTPEEQATMGQQLGR